MLKLCCENLREIMKRVRLGADFFLISTVLPREAETPRWNEV